MPNHARNLGVLQDWFFGGRAAYEREKPEMSDLAYQV